MVERKQNLNHHLASFTVRCTYRWSKVSLKHTPKGFNSIVMFIFRGQGWYIDILTNKHRYKVMIKSAC